MASVSPPPFSFASSSPLFDAATHLSRRDLRHCLDERLSLRSRGEGDRDRRGVNATTTTSKQHTIAAIPPLLPCLSSRFSLSRESQETTDAALPKRGGTSNRFSYKVRLGARAQEHVTAGDPERAID